MDSKPLKVKKWNLGIFLRRTMRVHVTPRCFSVFSVQCLWHVHLLFDCTFECEIFSLGREDQLDFINGERVCVCLWFVFVFDCFCFECLCFEWTCVGQWVSGGILSSVRAFGRKLENRGLTIRTQCSSSLFIWQLNLEYGCQTNPEKEKMCRKRQKRPQCRLCTGLNYMHPSGWTFHFLFPISPGSSEHRNGRFKGICPFLTTTFWTKGKRSLKPLYIWAPTPWRWQNPGIKNLDPARAWTHYPMQCSEWPHRCVGHTASAPKGAKYEVKQARRAQSRSEGPPARSRPRGALDF